MKLNPILVNTITIGVGCRIWTKVVSDFYLVHYANPLMHLCSTCDTLNHIIFLVHEKDIYDITTSNIGFKKNRTKYVNNPLPSCHVYMYCKILGQCYESYMVL
jgi:hypothetical protein